MHRLHESVPLPPEGNEKKKLTKTMFALFAVGLGALDELLLEYVMAFVDTGCRGSILYMYVIARRILESGGCSITLLATYNLAS